MIPYLAGIYFHEDVIEGSLKAAIISLPTLLPFLFIKNPKLFNRSSNWIVGFICAYLFLSLLSLSLCPHYWEVALTFFLSVGVFILTCTRWKLDHKFSKALSWYAVTTVIILAMWGLSWISDINSVIKGDRQTREEHHRERANREAEMMKLIKMSNKAQ
jgi:thiol:disulfide interchange protein